jgi:hypothetical protein
VAEDKGKTGAPTQKNGFIPFLFFFLADTRRRPAQFH